MFSEYFTQGDSLYLLMFDPLEFFIICLERHKIQLFHRSIRRIISHSKNKRIYLKKPVFISNIFGEILRIGRGIFQKCYIEFILDEVERK